MEFYKFHGQGNDFLIVEESAFFAAPAHASAPERAARALCERRYGAGADGLIAVAPSETPDADFRMTLWNADGSRAEMSGNGVRCLAAYLCQVGNWTSETLRIATDAGVKSIRLAERDGDDFHFTVDLGRPIFEPERIPFIPTAAAAAPPLVRTPVQVGDMVLEATVLSMGNPHCSIFLEDAAADSLLALGPRIETAEGFPRRTNVEFVRVADRGRIRVTFWERGVGRTLSSGTGSCAAAAAAMLRGATERRVIVETEAGELTVEWPENGSVSLTGPARRVYQGVWPS
jgi:diaminopimelate epimerase